MGIRAEVSKRRLSCGAAPPKSTSARIHSSLNVPRAASAAIRMLEAIIHKLGFLPAYLGALTIEYWLGRGCGAEVVTPVHDVLDKGRHGAVLRR